MQTWLSGQAKRFNLAVDANPSLPHRDNIARSEDVLCWVTLDEQQVSAHAGTNLAAISQMKTACGHRSCGRQRLQWRKALANQQLKLAVQ